MSKPIVALVGLSAVAVAIGAHLFSKQTRQRAQERYREIVGPEFADQVPEVTGMDREPLTGWWGGIAIALRFVEAFAIVCAIGSLLFILIGP